MLLWVLRWRHHWRAGGYRRPHAPAVAYRTGHFAAHSGGRTARGEVYLPGVVMALVVAAISYSQTGSYPQVRSGGRRRRERRGCWRGAGPAEAQAAE